MAVGQEWLEFSGSQWQEEFADQWVDWLDRRDLDKYLALWKDAHRRGTPILAGCRLLMPNGRLVDCRTSALPVIARRRHYGLRGVCQMKFLD